MKLRVGILGATGMVGQRFIAQLYNHPWFEITSLMASERSAGKAYKEVAKWYIEGEIPEEVSEMIVEEINPQKAEKGELDLVFSAIPASIALEVEASFAKHVPVYSNTRTYRMEKDVPLVVGDVNPDHLQLVEVQREKRGWRGGIVTNPNCSTIGLVVPLKPIYDNWGIEFVHVATMQALSGAGYSGVPSMAILDNLIPFISGEEEKVESEPLKILGSLEGDEVKNASFSIMASCNRVMILDGHTEAVFLKTEEEFELDEVVKALKSYSSEPQKLELPTAPVPPIVVREEEDRPQPRRDRNAGRGMAVSVGRLRKNEGKLLKFICLSHNTIRGAAGASVLNAELAYKKGLLKV